MKKIVLLLAFFVAANITFAQLHFGPKIGYNTSKLSVDKTDISSGLKNSFQFGAFVRLGGSGESKIYLQPEVNFLTQGGIFDGVELESLSPFKQEVNLKTVQIPLIVGAKLIDLKVASLRILGGPAASIVTNSEIENKISNYIEPIKEADIKNMIWSFQVGAGIDVLMFTLDIRYNIGLNKLIDKINIDGEPVSFESKTSGFNVSLGWKIF